MDRNFLQTFSRYTCLAAQQGEAQELRSVQLFMGKCDLAPARPTCRHGNLE